MSAADLLVAGATVVSGALSLSVIVGAVIDVITSGWIRSHWRKWNGYDGLHRDHQITQAFINDLGRGFNELSETVCNEHDISERDRPDRIDVERYERLIDPDRDVSPGDFLRGGD